LQRFAALLALLVATAAVLPMLSEGAIFGPDAKPGGGTHYTCSSAPHGWHAKLGG
jgi:hypothetical protein